MQPVQPTPEGKTVQEYIDETPVWADGTKVSFSPMTQMQWRIWCLATAGKFFEGLVVFMTGVALPLIVKEFNLTAMEKGLVSAAPLAGILIGASGLGGLADQFGRKLMFILEMVLFSVFLGLTVFASNFHWLLVCLFGMGTALGCDYPTAHMVISESIPSTSRGKLVLSAFGFQAVGALVGTAVGYLILSENQDISSWRWMYATAVAPAVLVFLGRFFIPDSGHWLVSKNKIVQAEQELHRLLDRYPPYPKKINLIKPDTCPSDEQGEQNGKGYLTLFKGKNKRATILASLPWFLQDLGTYGIGIFTPTILASIIGAETKYAHKPLGDHSKRHDGRQGRAALLDLLLLVGIVLAVLLVDRVGRIKLQIGGFIGCAMGFVSGRPFTQLQRRAERFSYLRRVHDFQPDDQHGPQLHDLSHSRRGVSHPCPRQGGRFRRFVRQGRRHHHGVFIPNIVKGYRHPGPAIHPGWHISGGGADHLAVRHRNHGSQSGGNRISRATGVLYNGNQK